MAAWVRGEFGREWICVYVWLSLTWNYHNIVNQPCCYSVIKAYLTLCNPLDCSMPGFSVLHYLLEFAWIHVHLSQWCYLTISFSDTPFSFAFNLSQHQGIHPKINLKVFLKRKPWAYRVGWRSCGVLFVCLLFRGMPQDIPPGVTKIHWCLNCSPHSKWLGILTPWEIGFASSITFSPDGQ